MTALARLFPDRWKPGVARARHRVSWQRGVLARPTRRFVRAHGLVVRAGPFKGMAYPSSTVGFVEQLVPKLLASYECELHPALEQLVAEPFERIVDIGAADGYYAVGLARAVPSAEVEAFEMNQLPARVCAQLAAANGVGGRVRMRGECTLDELRELSPARTLVFADCEGCELELLDPAQVAVLRTATVVAELHEALAPGVEAELPARFEPTHRVELLDQKLRHSGSFGELEELTTLDFVDRELLVSEFRPHPVKWAVMTPTGAA